MSIFQNKSSTFPAGFDDFPAIDTNPDYSTGWIPSCAASLKPNREVTVRSSRLDATACQRPWVHILPSQAIVQHAQIPAEKGRGWQFSQQPAQLLQRKEVRRGRSVPVFRCLATRACDVFRDSLTTEVWLATSSSNNFLLLW